MTGAPDHHHLTAADALAMLQRANPTTAISSTDSRGAVTATASPVDGPHAGLDDRARADLRVILAGKTSHGTDRIAAATALRRLPVRDALPSSSPRARRRRVLQTALPLAATAAATTAILVAALQPQEPALASWTPVPATAPGAVVDEDDITTWTSECIDLTGAGVGIGGARAPAADAPRQVLVDRRGDLTYCVDYYRGAGTDTDPTVVLSGLRGPDVQQTASTVLGGGSPALTVPGGSDVLVVGGDSTAVRPRDEDGSSSDLSEQAFTQVGFAGPDVRSVEVVLTNGLHVTATLQDGLWGVWWPNARGDVIGARLLVRTAAGERTVDPATVGLD